LMAITTVASTRTPTRSAFLAMTSLLSDLRFCGLR
jgi:hypothetical protein